MRPKSLPPLKTLPAFIATAQLLSFSKAAESLFVTHSAISQSIKLLETFLNKPLFERKASKVSLTDAGQQYYTDINNAFNIIKEATQQQLGTTPSNVLTVNVMTTLAMRWLIPRLPNFQTQYPQTDLRLSTIITPIDFSGDNIDIAITYGHADDWPDLQVRRLFDDKLILVASSNLIFNTENIASIIDQYKCIYVSSQMRQYDWPTWCKAMNLKYPKTSQRIYFSSSAQALQAVASQLGIMVTHEPFIVDDLKSGQLIKLAQSVPVDKNIYLTYVKKNHKKIQQFCDWICHEATKSLK